MADYQGAFVYTHIPGPLTVLLFPSRGGGRKKQIAPLCLLFVQTRMFLRDGH